MSFDYAKIKQALRDAGHEVSEGAHMLANDFHHLAIFAERYFGIAKRDLGYALAYPATLTKLFPGHPHAEPAPSASLAAIAPEHVEAAEVEPAPASDTVSESEKQEPEAEGADAHAESVIEQPAEAAAAEADAPSADEHAAEGDAAH